jgi:hypothetical protein
VLPENDCNPLDESAIALDGPATRELEPLLEMEGQHHQRLPNQIKSSAVAQDIPLVANENLSTIVDN